MSIQKKGNKIRNSEFDFSLQIRSYFFGNMSSQAVFINTLHVHGSKQECYLPSAASHG